MSESSTEGKTHWKKNIDSNFISGEDLVSELKGLKRSMNVEIERFDDRDTFDKNTQSEITKSALYLREIGGKSLYKPVLLNKTNAVFFEKLTGSPFLEHWVGAKAVIFAQPDKRFGHVVRFKSYKEPVKVDAQAIVARINSTTTEDELRDLFLSLKPEEKTPEVVAAKDARKTALTAK